MRRSKKYAKMQNLIPHEAIQTLKDEADAERLAESIFGPRATCPNYGIRGLGHKEFGAGLDAASAAAGAGDCERGLFGDKMMDKRTQSFGLIAWLAVTFIAAAIGSAASIGAQSFYTELIQPSWAPPGYVFGPVWTVLYTLMAGAAWLVWRVDGFTHARTALIFYLVQLVTNALWSWLFFVWNLGLLSFIEILLLLALILTTVIHFWRIKPLAGVLLVPYLLWVIFAAFLNFTLWDLNPHILG